MCGIKFSITGQNLAHSSAHARNHVMLEMGRKPLTAIMLGDVDFTLTVSDLSNLAAFTAIFS